MSNSSPVQPSPNKYLLAYQAIFATIAAVPDTELRHKTIDIFPATNAVLAALPKILAVRAQIAELPGFDMNHVDGLETITMALSHAQTLCAWETKASDALVAKVASLQATSEIFTADIEALARRNLFSNDQLKRVRANQGYKNIAYNVMDLTSFLREHFPTIQGKCALTLDEIEAASTLAHDVAKALAERDTANAQRPAAIRTRDQAFSLFRRSTDQVRRALNYLFFDTPEKVDEIFPSLYAGRGGRPEKQDAEDAQETAAPNAPTDSNVKPAAPPPPVVPTNGATQPNGAAQPKGQGMPGGSPIA